MILYQTAYSSVSCKLRVGLALKGLSLPMEPPPGGSTASPAFRALVPAGTVPALVDGDLVLTESDAILEYLDELHPAAPLLPGPPALRARTRMLSRLHDFRIDLPLRVLYGQIRLAQRDETRVTDSFARLADGLALIATLADPDGPFLLGPTPTLADCAWPANLQWLAAMASAFEVPLPLPPRLEALQTALSAHPAVAGAMAGYPALVSAWVVGARR